jgi:hypothetical protein
VAVDKPVFDVVTPKWDSPFDLIPLPSRGKTYKGVKSSIKVSYMTGSDEDILTSANLLESGTFLEVLLTRNILEQNLKYDELLLGDRNAIMIWLRGTAFGTDYPITIINQKGEAEDSIFDLNTLEYIYLDEEVDSDGLCTFTSPSTGDVIKFKFLTVGDEKIIDAKLEDDSNNKVAINHKASYTLERQIVSVNGNSEPKYLSSYISNMRLGDIRAFRKNYDSKESGVNLNIEVRTAGGMSVKTFLPFNLNFFWIHA